jgi:hypothetical protein
LMAALAERSDRAPATRAALAGVGAATPS